MPKGKPNSQTIATQKYQEKIGLISKSFKLKKSLVEDFRIACDKKGVTQAAQISKMMQEFVNSTKK